VKILLTRVLPFLLPLLAYLAWWYLARRKALAQGSAKPGIQEGPWALAIATALMLAVLGLIVFGAMRGEEPGGVYVPPAYKDGRIVPGHIER